MRRYSKITWHCGIVPALLLVILIPRYSRAQASLVSRDTGRNERSTAAKVILLTYMRAISDAKGNKRIDENVVGNFRLFNWLRLEAGFRQGHRPHLPDAYYHYKLELQSGYFRKTIRVIARISDDIINSPAPAFRKTNELFAAEARWRISRLLMLNGGLGFVFSSQQNDHPDLLPTSLGIQSNYPVFRISLRMNYNEKGLVELTYGSYDVFNPYYYNSPFYNILTEREISKHATLFSYFRYQYNNAMFRPLNYFLCLGLRCQW